MKSISTEENDIYKQMTWKCPICKTHHCFNATRCKCGYDEKKEDLKKRKILRKVIRKMIKRCPKCDSLITEENIKFQQLKKKQHIKFLFESEKQALEVLLYINKRYKLFGKFEKEER